MDRLREDILDLGQADGHVLIDGETGTGKTLVAHALHAVGPRASKKFVPISCAAWADEVLAAKLFGPMEDGSPLVEEARGGTLCLEDIEALPTRCRRGFWPSSTIRAARRNPDHRHLQRPPARAAGPRIRCAPTCSIA
jgi:DNA-binding NtrC family response regulator